MLLRVATSEGVIGNIVWAGAMVSAASLQQPPRCRVGEEVKISEVFLKKLFMENIVHSPILVNFQLQFFFFFLKAFEGTGHTAVRNPKQVLF